jgi:gamma-glutamylcyclotransferase (GGCT)/AIG2-like uncharacterized protein YtfP
MDHKLVKRLTGKEFLADDAILHGYKKIFEGEYPIIVKSQGSSVAGKVIKGIDEKSLSLIDLYEGAGYTRKKVIAHMANGECDVFAYVGK